MKWHSETMLRAEIASLRALTQQLEEALQQSNHLLLHYQKLGIIPTREEEHPSGSPSTSSARPRT
jgi:hypothetical protein